VKARAAGFLANPMDQDPWALVVMAGSDYLHAPTHPAFAVDHLPALFRPHPGAESDVASAFHFADLVRVMHVCGSCSFIVRGPFGTPS